MKSCFIALLLSFTACTAVAQWTGPAWNPRCYYPEVGNRAEIDTIFGAKPEAELGVGIRNIGPRPGEAYGTVASVISPGRFGVPAHSSFDGGPNFDLHHLIENKRLNFNPEEYVLKIGHFRDTYHNDILTTTVGYQLRFYWEDDAGNYDSARFSLCATRLPNGKIVSGSNTGVTLCAHLTSDSVLDVVYPYDVLPFFDSIGLSIIKGGQGLKNETGQDTIVQDMSTLWHSDLNSDTTWFTRTAWPSDLNGRGKGVLSQDEKGNLFFYNTAQNFTLASLARALTFDTLLVASSIPNYVREVHLPDPSEIHVFEKQQGEYSTDLIVPIEFAGREYWSLTFKGNPEFGLRRLTIDSAAFVLHSPSQYGASQFDQAAPVAYADCGDMTGRGNHVLCVEYELDPLFRAYCFYELGSELDDKIDLFYTDGPQRGFGSIDTLTANADKLQDVIIGEGSRYDYNLLPNQNYGSIHIVFGSSKIPSRTSRSVAALSTETGILGIYPNPVRGSFAALSSDISVAGVYHCEVHDMLGRLIYSREYDLSEGSQSVPVQIPNASNGTYVIMLSRANWRASQKIIISR